jgi:predicted thioredoxin/glutaredoxin
VIPFSDSKDENNEKICLEILQSSLLFSTIATLKKKVESIVEAKDIVEFVTVKFYWG